MGCWCRLSELLHLYHHCRFYQRLNGRKNTGIFRKKDRSKRNEDCLNHCIASSVLNSCRNCLSILPVCTQSYSISGWLNNPGNHGYSEMLYEFTSSSANNGSGFEGLGDNTPFWNIACGTVMLLQGSYPSSALLPLQAFLAKKKYIPESAGTLKTDTSNIWYYGICRDIYCCCISHFFLP